MLTWLVVLTAASKLQHMHSKQHLLNCLPAGRCAWLCDVSAPIYNTTERRASTCKLPFRLKSFRHSGHWKSFSPPCTVLKCVCQQPFTLEINNISAPSCLLCGQSDAGTRDTGNHARRRARSSNASGNTTLAIAGNRIEST